MQNILIIGAGRSTYFLINYLLTKADQHNWQITVADFSRENLDQHLEGIESVVTQVLDLADNQARGDLIAKQDVVVSMAPPVFHGDIAKDCLLHGQHLLTASYLSTTIEGIHQQAVQKGLLFLNELGLDPGLDHLSAKQIIDDLKAEGATIQEFYSYAGGLVAPSSDDNPWHYKISWNPMNVVRAGQSWARFKAEGRQKIVPYQQLFNRLENIEVPGYGTFDAYYNRNALPYEQLYGLDGLDSLVRGTLRKKGFCQAWDLLVKTGLTTEIEAMDLKNTTLAQFLDKFLPADLHKNIQEKWCDLLGVAPDDEAFQTLKWLGLMTDQPVPISFGTPAEVLKNILVDKLEMNPDDRDLIIMVHYFTYDWGGDKRQRKSYLTMEGEDGMQTAMAKTVGLPLGIATKLLMTGALNLSGVRLPMDAAIYEPVLAELKDHGIIFREEDYSLKEKE